MSDPTTMLLFVINGLFAIVGAGGAWWMNNIWNMVRSQQELLASLHIELAKNYVPRAELQHTFQQIFSKLDDIQKDVRASQ